MYYVSVDDFFFIETFASSLRCKRSYFETEIELIKEHKTKLSNESSKFCDGSDGSNRSDDSEGTVGSDDNDVLDGTDCSDDNGDSEGSNSEISSRTMQ